VVGGLVGGPVGVLAGGALGHGAETPPSLPLDVALQAEFKKQGVTLIQLYRRGPFRLEALFLAHGGYWTVASAAPQVPGWHQIDLDDWLFGDLVDGQLMPWLQANSVIFQ
jgi:hypothetical protein